MKKKQIEYSTFTVDNQQQSIIQSQYGNKNFTFKINFNNETKRYSQKIQNILYQSLVNKCSTAFNLDSQLIEFQYQDEKNVYIIKDQEEFQSLVNYKIENKNLFICQLNISLAQKQSEIQQIPKNEIENTKIDTPNFQQQQNQEKDQLSIHPVLILDIINIIKDKGQINKSDILAQYENYTNLNKEWSSQIQSNQQYKAVWLDKCLKQLYELIQHIPNQQNQQQQSENQSKQSQNEKDKYEIQQKLKDFKEQNMNLSLKDVMDQTMKDYQGNNQQRNSFLMNRREASLETPGGNQQRFSVPQNFYSSLININKVNVNQNQQTPVNNNQPNISQQSDKQKELERKINNIDKDNASQSSDNQVSIIEVNESLEVSMILGPSLKNNQKNQE